MNPSRILLALAASVLAVSAHAGGIQARDVPRISNGGTGVIGGVEPGAYPYQAGRAMPQAQAPSHTRMQSNAHVQSRVDAMPQAQAQGTRGTMVMGAAAAPSTGGLAPRHPAWGTPD